MVCCALLSLYPKAKIDCIAPVDEMSSCSDLLRTDFFRAVLWLLSVLAVLGNVGVFVYRVFLEPGGTSGGYRVLVSNLCVSDLLMGMYLLMVGWADAHYKGDFVWKRDEWTHSMMCQVAGFLALVSSEVSAFIICLITLDRLLVLHLPLKHHLHLTARSATLTCGAAWLVGAVLGVVPLLPANPTWNFYNQNAICLPLPIIQHRFPGQHYAFALFIVLNFLLFLFVGAGQVFIYRSIRSTSVAASSKDTAIARRLSLIVFSDFCCWFPIGLMGLLAVRGTPIPSVVNVWAAILVVPLNSALNPFLYTLATLRERRNRRREQERIQAVMGRLHTEVLTWPTDRLLEPSHHVTVAVAGHLSSEPPQPLSQQAASSSAPGSAGPVRQEPDRATTPIPTSTVDALKAEEAELFIRSILTEGILTPDVLLMLYQEAVGQEQNREATPRSTDRLEDP